MFYYFTPRNVRFSSTLDLIHRYKLTLKLCKRDSYRVFNHHFRFLFFFVAETFRRRSVCLVGCCWAAPLDINHIQHAPQQRERVRAADLRLHQSSFRGAVPLRLHRLHRDHRSSVSAGDKWVSCFSKLTHASWWLVARLSDLFVCWFSGWFSWHPFFMTLGVSWKFSCKYTFFLKLKIKLKQFVVRCLTQINMFT